MPKPHRHPNSQRTSTPREPRFPADTPTPRASSPGLWDMALAQPSPTTPPPPRPPALGGSGPHPDPGPCLCSSRASHGSPSALPPTHHTAVNPGPGADTPGPASPPPRGPWTGCPEAPPAPPGHPSCPTVRLQRHPTYPECGHRHHRPRSPLDMGMGQSEGSPAPSSFPGGPAFGRHPDTMRATPRPPAPVHQGGGHGVTPHRPASRDSGTPLCVGSRQRQAGHPEPTVHLGQHHGQPGRPPPSDLHFY